MTLHWAPLPVECVYCGTEAPLPRDVLRDIPDETVKAPVDCLVITVFFAVTTTTVIGAALGTFSVVPSQLVRTDPASLGTVRP